MAQSQKKTVTLQYGNQSIPLPENLPRIYEFLIPSSDPKPPRDAATYINTVLDSPLDSVPFNNFFQKGDSVLIILSDSTRTTLSELYLPVIIERLNHRGIADRDITLLCALGIHRKQTTDEHKALLGSSLYDRFKITDHNPDDKASMIGFGTTKRGTPVEINQLLSQTDKILLTGSIRFHYFAGFSGGRKSILPGVASFDACVANHLLVLNPQDQGGRNSCARTGVLQGNPVHEDMEEAARAVSNLFLFNTIVSPQQELLHAVAGDLHTAFNSGCQFLKKHCSIPLPMKADLVIASCGGYPWDINFIQAHKTMDMASGVLRDGGVMILLADCSQGFGNPRFVSWFKHDTPRTFEENLRKHYEINGQTAYATFLKARKHHIILISRLTREEVLAASMIPALTLDDAVEQAYHILGKNPRTYIIPVGSSCLPYIV